jgi:hypothetical protein
LVTRFGVWSLRRFGNRQGIFSARASWFLPSGRDADLRSRRAGCSPDYCHTQSVVGLFVALLLEPIGDIDFIQHETRPILRIIWADEISYRARYDAALAPHEEPGRDEAKLRPAFASRTKTDLFNGDRWRQIVERTTFGDREGDLSGTE